MSLSDFLAGEGQAGKARPSRKCSICRNPKLADEVVEYVAGRKDGSISHTVNWIWEHYFAPNWGIMAPNSLRNHIRHHLGEDL